MSAAKERRPCFVRPSLFSCLMALTINPSQSANKTKRTTGAPPLLCSICWAGGVRPAASSSSLYGPSYPEAYFFPLDESMRARGGLFFCSNVLLRPVRPLSDRPNAIKSLLLLPETGHNFLNSKFVERRDRNPPGTDWVGSTKKPNNERQKRRTDGPGWTR